MFRKILTAVAAVFGSAISVVLLLYIFFIPGTETETIQTDPTDQPVPVLMDNYNALIADTMNEAHEAALAVKKHFWINDDAVIAPAPDQEKFGETDDPSSLQWLLDEAADLLDGQDTLFSTDIEICPGTKVTYYLDDTILAITWRQVFHNFVYTISEVKVADPSQFRRYLANNEYNSDYLYWTTEMAAEVNSVVASSADYYRGRVYGIIVYDGEVKRISHGRYVDTCYVDDNGDLIFSYRGEILDQETAQKFVDDNNISFSICFGPVLVDNGVRCEHDSYALGEVNDHYPRAALCQRDDLHYLVVTANGDKSYYNYPTIHMFAETIAQFGCEKAYTMDGGQTGAIAMNGKLMNPVQFGEQRRISDIIYFATAIPDQQ